MASRITIKGQVTIPKEVRDELGLTPGTKVGFTKVGGRYVLVKEVEAAESYLADWAGTVDLGMSVDEFLDDMRGPRPSTKKGGR
jgi:AbrB family looped-hinge helix DNA binding protein